MPKLIDSTLPRPFSWAWLVALGGAALMLMAFICLSYEASMGGVVDSREEVPKIGEHQQGTTVSPHCRMDMDGSRANAP